RTVDVTLFYSPNATIYRVSTDAAFTGAEFMALGGGGSKSFPFTFDQPGSQTLYVEFQDKNGTATNVSAAIDVVLFPTELGAFTVDGGAVSSTTGALTFVYTKPKNAAEVMICGVQTFAGCAWAPASGAGDGTFADGATLYVKFRDAHHFESPVYTQPFLV